jgi:A/G-specific adenine glycosylase
MGSDPISISTRHLGLIRRKLAEWYRRAHRKLPWRATRDPYRIWVSEIMLQQTRVAAVIPFYEKFLARFPSAGALASAPEQELLSCWSGLGYYSRARNLQKAAQQVVERGGFPRDYESIRGLAGVGDYTAAAIASIAFRLPHAVMDGNVLRVLARLTNDHGSVRSSAVRQRLKEAADHLVDPRNPGRHNQALMELGATICLPKQPQCLLCPLAGFCEGRRRGTQNQLPVKASRAAPVRIEKTLLVIERRGKLLLWQRPPDSPKLAGFWELPEAGQLPGPVIVRGAGSFRHSITNHDYCFTVAAAAIRRTPRGYCWVARQELGRIPLSTTTRKALANYDV